MEKLLDSADVFIANARLPALKRAGLDIRISETLLDTRGGLDEGWGFANIANYKREVFVRFSK